MNSNMLVTTISVNGLNSTFSKEQTHILDFLKFKYFTF